MNELLTIGGPIAGAMTLAIVALWKKVCDIAKAQAKIQAERVTDSKDFAQAIRENSERMTKALCDATSTNREFATTLHALVKAIRCCPLRSDDDHEHPAHPAAQIDTEALMKRARA
jgi:hypothetical protein